MRRRWPFSFFLRLSGLDRLKTGRSDDPLVTVLRSGGRWLLFSFLAEGRDDSATLGVPMAERVVPEARLILKVKVADSCECAAALRQRRLERRRRSPLGQGRAREVSSMASRRHYRDSGCACR